MSLFHLGPARGSTLSWPSSKSILSRSTLQGRGSNFRCRAVLPSRAEASVQVRCINLAKQARLYALKARAPTCGLTQPKPAGRVQPRPSPARLGRLTLPWLAPEVDVHRVEVRREVQLAAVRAEVTAGRLCLARQGTVCMQVMQ